MSLPLKKPTQRCSNVFSNTCKKLAISGIAIKDQAQMGLAREALGRDSLRRGMSPKFFCRGLLPCKRRTAQPHIHRLYPAALAFLAMKHCVPMASAPRSGAGLPRSRPSARWLTRRNRADYLATADLPQLGRHRPRRKPRRKPSGRILQATEGAAAENELRSRHANVPHWLA